MARTTTVDTTEERNTFVLELLRSQPEIKSSDVQEKLKSKFGATVPSKVLNQLRDQAQAELEASAEAQPEPSFEDPADLLKASATTHEPQGNGTPAQKSARAGKGARLKHVFIEAPREQLDFLERVVAQLQEAGVANLRIDHNTERWLVFAVEGK